MIQNRSGLRSLSVRPRFEELQFRHTTMQLANPSIQSVVKKLLHLKTLADFAEDVLVSI
jgi:hypothetical protein